MTGHRKLGCTLLLVLACGRAAAQTPIGTEFSYQGQLAGAGTAVTGNADFRFALFDAETGGAQVGTTQARDNVAISNGTFTLSLDFGAAAFQSDARWLEVSVRSPAGAGGFTTLAPRQLLTPTPNATYSLQTRGISVDAEGQVGIGTAIPGRQLTVAGDMELGTSPADQAQLRLGGGSSYGFLFSSLGQLGDGIHLGYNHFFQGAQSQIINQDEGTSRLSLGYGTIALCTNFAHQPPVEALIVDRSGRVGIGTSSPDARLEVTGEGIKTSQLSSNDITYRGQMFVYGGEQGASDNDHLIWRLGDYQAFGINNPDLRMISPVTGDSLAGFYRDVGNGNGVMFADDKNFRAPNPADPATDIWYCCSEGPEAAMYVRGTARLTNGRATIELPDHFRNLASEPGMTVQLTPISIDSKGLTLIKKSLDGIEVGELGGGTGNYEFDWRVEAVRKGWENYKVIRPWMHSDSDPDKAWQNRLKAIEERRVHGEPSPVVNADTPRPRNEVNKQ